MHIRTEKGNGEISPMIMTVTTAAGETHYFVEILCDGNVEGYIRCHSLYNVCYMVNIMQKRGGLDTVSINYGEWFCQYEDVCRWINNHRGVDEVLTEENW